MSLLTSRQAEELHKSIIAYLAANNLTATTAALRTELNLEENDFDAATAERYKGLLEKKWTSVVRLQKKIMDLESRNATLQSELDSATPASLSMRNKDPSSWLPKPNPRYTLESHRKTINCIAFHSSGSRRRIRCPRGNILLASCSSDLTIKLWDPANDASRDQTLKIWDVITGFCLKTLRGHAGWVRDVSPTFDDRYILSAGDDMTARLWDISSTTQTESKVTMFGHEHHIECCAIAPPTSYKFIALTARLKKPPPLSSSAEYFATGSRDKTIRLWDARGTCLLTLVGHDNWIRALVFHPGGKYLLSVSDDKTLRCWDLSQDGRCVKVIGEPHERFITSLHSATTERLQGAEVSDPSAPHGPTIDGNPGGKSGDVQIRCVVATAGVDCKLRIFTN
ncbi:nuclear distribution protein pac-1a [Xylariaceae sp. FL1651]|nr:nuclear distribution protein pac-1a [Xylariaceae sp. FL1651]